MATDAWRATTLEKAILNQSKRLVADADAALDLLLPGISNWSDSLREFSGLLKRPWRKTLMGIA